MPFRRPAKLSFRTRQPSAGHSPLEDGKKRLAKEEAAKAATEAAFGFLVVLAAVCLPMLPETGGAPSTWAKCLCCSTNKLHLKASSSPLEPIYSPVALAAI